VQHDDLHLFLSAILLYYKIDEGLLITPVDPAYQSCGVCHCGHGAADATAGFEQARAW
jgi:hypothetical protein